MSKPNLRIKRQPVARFLRVRFDVLGARHGKAFDRLAPGVCRSALPDGRRLITRRDAASYIPDLPNKQADFPEWQAAIETLMLVELSGPTMFGRIGVMQALNRGHIRDFNSARKRYTWGPATAIVMHGRPVSHCPRACREGAKGPLGAAARSWAPKIGKLSA